MRLNLPVTTIPKCGFNPRTHTGCDVQGGGSFDFEVRVSIHAPTRGATWRTGSVSYLYLFQSTHPHGVRPLVSKLPLVPVKVSIHAPTRGATSSAPAPDKQDKFQSTHPHGVRLYIQQMSEYQLNKVSISRS